MASKQPAIVRHGVIRARANVLTNSTQDPTEHMLDVLADGHYFFSRRKGYLFSTDHRNKVRLTGFLAYLKACHALLVEMDEDLQRQGISFKPKRRPRAYSSSMASAN